jgi:uncharacterized protein involved in response to NO
MGCKYSNKARRAKADGYVALIAAGEPFRLLFPLGTAIGILGVLLWPLHIWRGFPYPGVSHARIMIQGFLTCFVAGFLGTALPRLLDVPRMTLGETLFFAIALISVTIAHYTGHVSGGDQLFLLVLAVFVFALGSRFLLRKDTPPPGFVLVGFGLLSALAGSAILIMAQISSSLVSPAVLAFGKLLLYQGYLLLPVMGIGAFLLPRFFDLPNRQNFPESLAVPPGWLRRAAFASACGGAVLLSFAIESAGFARMGTGLRAAAVLTYLIREVPVHKAGVGGGSLALGLRVALFSIPAGYALIAWMPERMLSFLHVVYITGFSLLTFIVASRVVLGHSGQSSRFRAWIKPVFWMTLAVCVAMFTRVSADWMPRFQLTHYGYASIAWIIGVIIWAAAILPSVRCADKEADA